MAMLHDKKSLRYLHIGAASWSIVAMKKHPFIADMTVSKVDNAFILFTNCLQKSGSSCSNPIGFIDFQYSVG